MKCWYRRSDILWTLQKPEFKTCTRATGRFEIHLQSDLEIVSQTQGFTMGLVWFFYILNLFEIMNITEKDTCHEDDALTELLLQSQNSAFLGTVLGGFVWSWIYRHGQIIFSYTAFQEQVFLDMKELGNLISFADQSNLQEQCYSLKSFNLLHNFLWLQLICWNWTCHLTLTSPDWHLCPVVA